MPMKNFTAGLRKPALVNFNVLPVGSDLSWIEDIGFAEGLGAGGLVPVSITGTVNGTNGSDGNASFTLGSTPTTAAVVVSRGVVRQENVAFTRVGASITFVAPYIPIAGDPPLLAWIY